jgi:2-dehydro-3-deoxygalactonokinase
MVAIDWGTSSLRAYRLSAEGEVLERREAPKGILAVPAGRFPQVLEEQAGDWIAAGEAPVVMSGMIGSRQGWVEAPYAKCPAGLEDFASSLKKVEWGGKAAWIVPGLTCRDEAGVHDVMRGEETQILGVLDDLPPECVICLPGTHSKWVSIARKRICGFKTCMTGEVFAVLKTHSILGRMIEGEAFDGSAFLDGVKRSGQPGGLLHQLFGVRTRGLFGELTPGASGAYLSGILIGHELRQAEGAKRIFLLGAQELTDLYAKAAGTLGIQTKLLDQHAATVGLFRLAKRIGA